MWPSFLPVLMNIRMHSKIMVMVQVHDFPASYEQLFCFAMQEFNFDVVYLSIVKTHVSLLVYYHNILCFVIYIKLQS